MVQFMWQANLHKVAKVVVGCLDACHRTNSEGGQAFYQPYLFGRDVMFLSFSCISYTLSTPAKRQLQVTPALSRLLGNA